MKGLFKNESSPMVQKICVHLGVVDPECIEQRSAPLEAHGAMLYRGAAQAEPDAKHSPSVGVWIEPDIAELDRSATNHLSGLKEGMGFQIE